MLASPTPSAPTLPSQGGLLSIFSEPFKLPISCAREAEVASQPCSFDWSDFPVVGENNYYSSPMSPTSVHDVNTCSTSTCTTFAYQFGPSSFQKEPTFEFSSSSGSCSVVTVAPVTKSQSQTPVASPSNPLALSSHYIEASTTKSSLKSNNKRVSFSGILEIRTHSVVLGSHPCCLGGMALECGWSHCEDPEIIDLEVFEQVSAKRRSAELRLDYSQRRERLQEMTGLDGSQLLQLEYEMVCGGAAPLMLLHNTPSIRRFKIPSFDSMRRSMHIVEDSTRRRSMTACDLLQ